MPNQTPNQRLRDIGINVEYARQKRTENLQFEQQSAYLATLPAGCAMSQAHPSETATERAFVQSPAVSAEPRLPNPDAIPKTPVIPKLPRMQCKGASLSRRQRKGRLLSAQEPAFFAVFWAPQGHCGPGFIRWRRCGR
ncbi:MAG: hypothetical protein IKQ04_09705 [Oscillospiraceae bacterium]|nr:hypothetical protein [Oscillospiraceae bacterium]